MVPVSSVECAILYLQAPVASSHTRNVPSADAEASSCPPGEKAIAVTQSSCFVSVRRHVPLAVSHIRTVESTDADAISCPSGENAIAVAQSV